MGGAMKYFLKNILDREILRSMVSWTTKFFFEKFIKPPAPRFIDERCKFLQIRKWYLIWAQKCTQNRSRIVVGENQSNSLNPESSKKFLIFLIKTPPVCSAHQNAVLPVDAMEGDLTYKDLIKLTLSCLKYFH